MADSAKECVDIVAAVVDNWKYEFAAFLGECDAALDDAFNYERDEFEKEVLELYDEKKHHTYGKKHHDPYAYDPYDLKNQHTYGAPDPYGYSPSSYIKPVPWYETQYSYPGYKTTDYGYNAYANDPYAWSNSDLGHYDDYTVSYGY